MYASNVYAGKIFKFVERPNEEPTGLRDYPLEACSNSRIHTLIIGQQHQYFAAETHVNSVYKII